MTVRRGAKDGNLIALSGGICPTAEQMDHDVQQDRGR